MNNLSNKEQADLVKAFWNNYGRWFSIAILIGLLVGFGWRWYNNHEQKQQMSASVLYSNLLQKTLASGGEKPVDVAIMQQLKNDYPSSSYHMLAEMYLAGQDVSEGALQHAEKVLREAVHSGANSALIDLAKVRLARVFLAQLKPKEALQALGTPSENASNFMRMLFEIEQSKAYLALGVKAKAQQLIDSVQAQAKSAEIELPQWVFSSWNS
jgi:predicted negative regulator of RcsB-dependent stress response